MTASAVASVSLEPPILLFCVHVEARFREVLDEVDLWAGLEGQLQAAGVTAIHNPRRCTACDLDRYFSYRAEKGRTGRMLALLALAAPASRQSPVTDHQSPLR